MRILSITSPRPAAGWLAHAFAADSACEVLLDEAIGVAAGLTRLREEAFDAVLVMHADAELDAFELLDAIRTGSSEEQPIIVLGTASEQELAPLCYEAGADYYACINTITTRTLIWNVARAVERRRLIAENRHLQQAQRHRWELEHEEATRLLEQQRAMIADLESLRRESPLSAVTGETPVPPVSAPTATCPELPAPLIDHYRELLRIYVVMGSGNLAEEMAQLAELLATAHVTPHQVMRLHVFVLEEMVGHLGSRSARHVMNRADMLVLEVLINLAQGYRRRYLEELHPARQRWFPGFMPCGTD